MQPGVCYALDAAVFRRVLAENIAAMQRKSSLGSNLALSAAAEPSTASTVCIIACQRSDLQSRQLSSAASCLRTRVAAGRRASRDNKEVAPADATQ